MNFELFIRISLVIISLSVGAILGILRSKFFSFKYAKPTYWTFLVITCLIFLVPFICFFYLKQSSTENTEILFSSLIIPIISVITSGALIYTVATHLVIKDIFHTSELDPIVKKFTSNADTSQIKLFGGDLNFFGNIPSEMEENDQYTHLKSLNFNKVLIICEGPRNEKQRIRYGKILSDIPGAELKYYHPESADLRMRGRIIRVQGSDRLLMYSKIKSKTYRAIETDTSDSHGALYNNIWELVWSLATTPNEEEVHSYKIAFKNYIS